MSPLQPKITIYVKALKKNCLELTLTAPGIWCLYKCQPTPLSPSFYFTTFYKYTSYFTD